MFRTVPAAEPTHEVIVPADLLTQLELDLAPPSSGGRRAFLAANGITVLVDDIGRDAIFRADARRLITERREAEARQDEAEGRQAIELDPQLGAPAEPWPTDELDP
jgi:hypothetical protein